MNWNDNKFWFFAVTSSEDNKHNTSTAKSNEKARERGEERKQTMLPRIEKEVRVCVCWQTKDRQQIGGDENWKDMENNRNEAHDNSTMTTREESLHCRERKGREGEGGIQHDFCCLSLSCLEAGWLGGAVGWVSPSRVASPLQACNCLAWAG